MILKKFLNKSNSGGFCKLNYTYGLESNIIKLEFKKLYTHLIIQFYEEGLITDIIDLILNRFLLSINDIKELLKKDTFTEEENYLLNGLYLNISRVDFDSATKISGYMYNVMEYFYDKNRSNILYIDTDIIYMKEVVDESFIKSIGIPYKISKIENIYFFRQKSYVFEEDYTIKIRGIGKLNSIEEDIVLKMKSDLQSRIRDEKLDELLN